MKKSFKFKNIKLVLSIVMSSLIVGTIGVSSFAYWQSQTSGVEIPTFGFNATEEEFTYFACVPNVASETGYDYYDLEEIPEDLVEQVSGLAVARFEALTSTAYIPSYPSVVVGGTKFNYHSAQELPVIHVLKELHSEDAEISNGFSHIETLIIPETVTYIHEGAFSLEGSPLLKEVSFLGKEDNSGYLKYSVEEFSRLPTNKVHFQHKGTRTTSYSLEDRNYRFAQFNGGMEYDNKEKVYYSYVIPSEDILDSTVVTGVSELVSMNANTKYKITYDPKLDVLDVSKYEYKLTYTGINEPLALTLNTNVHYEEYIIPSNLGTIKILN